MVIADKMAAEFKRRAPATKVEFVNVREKDAAGMYQALLKIIPENVPIYTALTFRKSGYGSSSTYLFIRGRWIWFRGVQGAPKYFERTKE